MSYHVINPELEAIISKQRKNSTIASLMIGILLLSLLALTFWAITISIFDNKAEAILIHTEPSYPVEQIEKVKITPQVKKTPSPASPMSAPKVITAVSGPSAFSVSPPEVVVDSMSLAFNSSEDFGVGWGTGMDSIGGGAGGTFSFIGEEMQGDRVCFVIDYSMSMKGRRIELLKEELLETVETLHDGMKFELIFFAGPAWLGGSEVTNPSAKNTSTIVYEGKKYEWKCHNVNNWEHKGSRQNGEWETLDENTRQGNLKAIRNTELVWGTDWKNPLAIALEMKPAPDLIVFLTDGACGSKSMEVAEEIGRDAKNKGIKINTIALMEPKTRDAMAKLAQMSGGTFALIDDRGNKVNQLTIK